MGKSHSEENLRDPVNISLSESFGALTKKINLHVVLSIPSFRLCFNFGNIYQIIQKTQQKNPNQTLDDSYFLDAIENECQKDAIILSKLMYIGKNLNKLNQLEQKENHKIEKENAKTLPHS